MNAEQWLADPFEADTSAADYFERFMPYAEAGSALATKPWWPPLSEGWAV